MFRRPLPPQPNLANLSPATRRSYLAAVSTLSRYFGRSPDLLDLENVRAFQVHLAAIFCALRFFCGVTLGLDAIPEPIAYARPHRADDGLCRGPTEPGAAPESGTATFAGTKPSSCAATPFGSG
jgi:hypothetical protein